MVCPGCTSEDCAVTTHPLLNEVASTSILVIVATMRLLILRLVRLLKVILRPMMHMRVRTSAAPSMVSVFMLSDRLLSMHVFRGKRTPHASVHNICVKGY